MESQSNAAVIIEDITNPSTLCISLEIQFIKSTKKLYIATKKVCGQYSYIAASVLYVHFSD